MNNSKSNKNVNKASSSSHENRNRFQIMSYDQITRLTKMLCDKSDVFVDPTHLNPTASQFTLYKIIEQLQISLKNQHIVVKDIRLIGGAASYVIDPNSTVYSDIDLLFSLHACNNLDEMNRIRDAVMQAVTACYQAEHPSISQSAAAANQNIYCPEHLISKQVCVQNPQTLQFWSLFSIGHPTSSPHKSCSPVIELKFVGELSSSAGTTAADTTCSRSDTDDSLMTHNCPPEMYSEADLQLYGSIQRHYECSVDSFQLHLDPVLHFITNYSNSMSRDFYPISVIECLWGCIKTALHHLSNRIIHLDRPEMIRGGGLLKYCKLMVQGYQLDPAMDQLLLKKYMCARFFIDFPLITIQHHKIESYIYTHFPMDYQLHTDFLHEVCEVILTSSNYVDVTKVNLTMLLQDMIVERWSQAPTFAVTTAPISSPPSLASPASSTASSSTSTSTSTSNLSLQEIFTDISKWSITEITLLSDEKTSDTATVDSGINSSNHTIASPLVLSDNELDEEEEEEEEDTDEHIQLSDQESLSSWPHKSQLSNVEHTLSSSDLSNENYLLSINNL